MHLTTFSLLVFDTFLFQPNISSRRIEHSIQWFTASSVNFTQFVLHLFSSVVLDAQFDNLLHKLRLISFSNYNSEFCITLVPTGTEFIFLRFDISVLCFALIVKLIWRLSAPSSCGYLILYDYHSIGYAVQQKNTLHIDSYDENVMF